LFFLFAEVSLFFLRQTNDTLMCFDAYSWHHVKMMFPLLHCYI